MDTGTGSPGWIVEVGDDDDGMEKTFKELRTECSAKLSVRGRQLKPTGSASGNGSRQGQQQGQRAIRAAGKGIAVCR
jgi:hypothetical protein